MVKLLLDNGADTSIPTEFNELVVSVLDKSCVDYSTDDLIQLKDLLDPSKPPSLKLDNTEEKYILYKKNEKGIYVLANLKSNEKFLYHGFDISLFIYWVFKNNGFQKPVDKLLKNSINMIEEITSESLIQAILNVNKEWTVDLFTNEMNKFVMNYLTVTKWAFSLHYDMKKLYPSEEAFAVIPEQQKNYDLIFKLFSLRYEQFISGKLFNSNQKRNQLLNQLDLLP